MYDIFDAREEGAAAPSEELRPVKQNLIVFCPMWLEMSPM